MRLLVLPLLVFIAGCSSKPTESTTNVWIDLPAIGNELIATMSLKRSDVEKTFSLNGERETNIYDKTDSLFWATELSWLLSTDLNSPQLKGVLEAKDPIEDSKSNLTIRSVRPIEGSNVELKELDLSYLEDFSDIRQIHLVLGSSNYIATSRTSISVYMNRYNEQLLIDSIRLNGEDKVMFQDRRQYQSLAKRIK